MMKVDCVLKQDDMCQGDLFSYGKLLVVKKTLGTVDVVTSMSGSGYGPYLSSGEIDSI